LRYSRKNVNLGTNFREFQKRINELEEFHKLTVGRELKMIELKKRIRELKENKKMKNNFDVIIIGAGPAGLKCAEQLKNSDFSVLLIEKNKVIGPKVCAGGLTTLSASLDLPKSKMRNFDKYIFYLGDKKYEINLTNPIRIIDRDDLGQYLLQKIKDIKNITILKETIAKQIQKDRIITNKGEFYYRYLVGADGSNSIVRRFLGLKSEIFIALRYKISQMSNDIVWCFNPKLLRTGYLWIFPHRDYTNVGIYFNPKHLSSKKAKEILKDFLKKNSFVYSEENFGAAPLSFLYKGCIFKNIFLVGEAAGLVLKDIGEGISPAMIHGKEIGKKILDPSYKMPELKAFLKFKKRQEKLGKIADTFPFMQKYFFRILVNLLKTKWFQLYFGG